MCLRTPFLRISQAVGYAGILNSRVKHALLQLQEETCYASVLIRKIVDAEPFAIQRVEKALTDLLHPFLSSLSDFSELCGILLEESLFFDLLLQRLTDVFVFVFEDSTSKTFDLSNHVP